jgi:hypothetical protein
MPIGLHVVPRRALVVPIGLHAVPRRALVMPIGLHVVPRRALVVPRRAELFPCWRPFGPRDALCACIRNDAVVRVDDDADHDCVASGADRDGADEGADARLVGAVRVVGRLVVLR